MPRALSSDRKFFLIELQIERIQNPELWKHYQTKKNSMDAKNGQVTNEKLLFHGTDADSVALVNGKGFNRSYAGKNGKEARNLAASKEVSAMRVQAGWGQCGWHCVLSWLGAMRHPKF